MKLSKLFLMAAVVLGLGLTACNNDDVPVVQEEGNTHVGVTLRLALGNEGTRSTTENNYIGEWAGKDVIQNVAIYIVDVESGVVSTGQFAVGDFTVAAPNAANQITLTPLKAIRTTAGDKRVYALINGTPQAIAHLATASASDFENQYKEVEMALANSYTTTTASTSASKLVTLHTIEEEAIVMTNSADATVTVVDGVTESQAIAGTHNRASVQVKRAVARVMVTQASTGTYTLANGTGTISNVTWVLAQGENSLYLQQKATPYGASPNYDYVSNDANYYGTTTTAYTGYDYSGLWESNDNFQGGTTVPTMADYSTPLENVTDELNTTLGGKFILETTHASATDATSSYKKGNTAYVLVRATFTPTTFADGTTDYEPGVDDFYLGANGQFYASVENALNPATNGIAGQTVARYMAGKVLYYAWVNPDNVATRSWFNSPVYRNNVYHIHIAGFNTIGTNWNPLVPGDDPTTTDDDGNNPDPKPDNDHEPENPIKPEDPLTTPETWMSVDVTVLPWLVHSYQITF